MQHTIGFKRPDDETFQVYVDDQNVGNFNYGDHGWNGMQAAQQLMRAVGEKLGIPVVELD